MIDLPTSNIWKIAQHVGDAKVSKDFLRSRKDYVMMKMTEKDETKAAGTRG